MCQVTPTCSCSQRFRDSNDFNPYSTQRLLAVKQGWSDLLAILTLAALALAIRLPALEIRPMHADEAVQAARFRDWWQSGIYVYDPHEYHGPTLIYATRPSVIAGGAATFADTTAVTYRVVPVVFGVGMVLLLWFLRDALGRAGAVGAAILVGCSPAAVFYSRYYIHETLLACFTLAAIAGGWRYFRSGRLGWALATGAAVGLMQATKETAVIAYLAALCASFAVFLWLWLGRGEQHPRPWRWSHAAWSALTALLVAGLFLTSFGTNPRGLIDGVMTYLPWLSRAGGASPHIHPWYFYLQHLFWWRTESGFVWSEAAILVLALCGCAGCFWRGSCERENSQKIFVCWIGIYTLLVTAIYTLIPYKTPWCALQFLIGWILLAGVGIETLVRSARSRMVTTLIAAVLVAAVAHLGWQTYRASFVLADDPANPYVYAQTSADVVRLADELVLLSAASGHDTKMPIQVIWSDTYYWPLPWYVRQFEQVAWWTKMPPNVSAPVVLAAPRYDDVLTRELGDQYLMTGYYQLRPEVLLQLWVRMDVWETHLRRLGRI